MTIPRRFDDDVSRFPVRLFPLQRQRSAGDRDGAGREIEPLKRRRAKNDAVARGRNFAYSENFTRENVRDMRRKPVVAAGGRPCVFPERPRYIRHVLVILDRLV